MLTRTHPPPTHMHTHTRWPTHLVHCRSPSRAPGSVSCRWQAGWLSWGPVERPWWTGWSLRSLIWWPPQTDLAHPSDHTHPGTDVHVDMQDFSQRVKWRAATPFSDGRFVWCGFSNHKNALIFNQPPPLYKMSWREHCWIKLSWIAVQALSKCTF